MIVARRAQLTFGDRLIAEEVDGLYEAGRCAVTAIDGSWADGRWHRLQAPLRLTDSRPR